MPKPSICWWSDSNETGSWQNAPRVGEAMPPFMLPDESGHLVNLQELLCATARPRSCFIAAIGAPIAASTCTRLRVKSDAIAAAGGRVVVIMPERQEFAEKLQAEADAPFPVLTDLDNGYAMSLNLAIWLGPDIIQLISSSGRDLTKFQGNDAWMVPIPATFVVGRDGNVAARFIDPDFRKRMELDDLLAALKSAR